VTSRTFLVTGGAGFVGSHLVERLLARGDAVVVLDDLSTGRLGNLEPVAAHPRLTVVEGSVCDAAAVERLTARADHVVHLAAAVGVRLIVEEPVRTLETNIHGTEVVLRACGRRGTPVLVASSSEVYGKGAGGPFREDDDLVLGPTTRSRWSYAASKIVDEHLALSWHRERGLPVRIARFFNAAGPRQIGDHGMVLPRFVEQALSGGPVTVFGDGRQSRSFCHVLDTVEAVVRLVDAPAAVGLTVNVGSSEETAIRTLAQRVVAAAAALGGTAPARIEHVPYAEAYGAGFEDLERRAPDVSRLRAVTGFVPSRPLDEIVRDAVAWARTARAAAA
jgi:UDP-glucose 4-epimerase